MSDVAVNLHTLADTLNTALANFAQALKDRNYGCSAEIVVEGGQILGWGKINQHWTLFFRTSDSSTEDIPLTNASRGVRVRMTMYLYKLVAAIEEECTETARDVCEAIERVEAVTSKLSQR